MGTRRWEVDIEMGIGRVRGRYIRCLSSIVVHYLLARQVRDTSSLVPGCSPVSMTSILMLISTIGPYLVYLSPYTHLPYPTYTYSYTWFLMDP